MDNCPNLGMEGKASNNVRRHVASSNEYFVDPLVFFSIYCITALILAVCYSKDTSSHHA